MLSAASTSRRMCQYRRTVLSVVRSVPSAMATTGVVVEVEAHGEAAEVGACVAEGGQFPVEEQRRAAGLFQEVPRLQIVVQGRCRRVEVQTVV